MTITRTSHQHSPEDLAELVRLDGRLWPYWSSITAVAVALAESGGNAFAMPVVLAAGKPADRSVDVGLWQLNTYWQRRTFDSISELLDPSNNCRLAIDLCLFDGDPAWRPNWSYWTAYKAGAHNAYMGRARTAVNVVRAENGEAPL